MEKRDVEFWVTLFVVALERTCFKVANARITVPTCPYIVPTVKFGGRGIMMWACFSSFGLGPLELVHGTLNADEFQVILKNSAIHTLWQHDCVSTRKLCHSETTRYYGVVWENAVVRTRVTSQSLNPSEHFGWVRTSVKGQAITPPNNIWTRLHITEGMTGNACRRLSAPTRILLYKERSRVLGVCWPYVIVTPSQWQMYLKREMPGD